MRLLALGLAITVIVFVVGGHLLFLPLLFLPLGLFSFGHRQRRRVRCGETRFRCGFVPLLDHRVEKRRKRGTDPATIP
jgi:hypothetical protein